MSDKRYEISIVETGIEEVPRVQDWIKGGNNPNDQGYGYTEQILTKKTIKREIYTQNVDKLYLHKIIKAVNDL